MSSGMAAARRRPREGEPYCSRPLIICDGWCIDDEADVEPVARRLRDFARWRRSYVGSPEGNNSNDSTAAEAHDGMDARAAADVWLIGSVHIVLALRKRIEGDGGSSDNDDGSVDSVPKIEYLPDFTAEDIKSRFGAGPCGWADCPACGGVPPSAEEGPGDAAGNDAAGCPLGHHVDDVVYISPSADEYLNLDLPPPRTVMIGMVPGGDGAGGGGSARSGWGISEESVRRQRLARRVEGLAEQLLHIRPVKLPESRYEMGSLVGRNRTGPTDINATMEAMQRLWLRGS